MTRCMRKYKSVLFNTATTWITAWYREGAWCSKCARTTRKRLKTLRRGQALAEQGLQRDDMIIRKRCDMQRKLDWGAIGPYIFLWYNSTDRLTATCLDEKGQQVTLAVVNLIYVLKERLPMLAVLATAVCSVVLMVETEQMGQPDTQDGNTEIPEGS